MGKRGFGLVAVAAASTVLWAYSGQFVRADDRPNVKVYASKIIANDMNTACKAFTERDGTVRVTVFGGRIVEGFKNLIKEPKNSLAVSSRRMSDEERKSALEKGLELEEQILSGRAIAIVVNAGIPVKILTLDQVEKIFSGTCGRWSEVGGPTEPIVVFARPDPQDGIAVWFRKKVLGGKPVVKEALKVSFDNDMLRAVSRNSRAIGYASERKALPDNVKSVAIQRTAEAQPVSPSAATIRDRSYPLLMDIFVYHDKKSAGSDVESLLQFVKTNGL